MKNIKNKNSAFSIIEVLVAILIFSLGITSIYMLISSSLKANTYNENQIISANLSREGIELIRNIRDSNYKFYKIWNLINPSETDNLKLIAHNDSNVYFGTGNIYTIENNYEPSASFPIKVSNITSLYGVGESESELNGTMSNYRLCIDSNGAYTYDCATSGNTKTHFYRYLKIEKVENKDGVIDNALKVKSKVIWYQGGYHELEINTIITDWKRL